MSETANDAFSFVVWFRSVAPYIHAWRGKTFVVALCGELIAEQRLTSFAQDIALLNAIGIRIVLVHGFRPQIEEQLRAKGYPSRHAQGMRITDALALDCAQEAAGQVRYEIEAALSQGLPNTPMANAHIRVISGNFITARPAGIINGMDFEHTGLVRKIDAAGIGLALDSGAIVLLSPFGYSPTGEAFNLTMEDVAAAAAEALKADKLIFAAEIDGVRDHQSGGALIAEMAPQQARDWLATEAQSAQPSSQSFYLRHALRAVEGGAGRGHIIPFALDGALLLEIFTHRGVGTMLADEKLESLRQARSEDLGSLQSLLSEMVQAGFLVERSRGQIERELESYTVLEHDGVILGCAGLHPYAAEKSGEMFSLAVSPRAQGTGLGERLLKRIEQRARALGLEQIFVLTTRTMHWFLKRGFADAQPNALPEERRANYDTTRRSRVLVKRLTRAD